MDCSLPGSSVHGIFQARVLEWGAIAFSTDSFQISLLSIEIGQNLQTPNCHIIPSSPTRLLKLYVERHSKHIHTLVIPFQVNCLPPLPSFPAISHLGFAITLLSFKYVYVFFRESVCVCVCVCVCARVHMHMVTCVLY